MFHILLHRHRGWVYPVGTKPLTPVRLVSRSTQYASEQVLFKLFSSRHGFVRFFNMGFRKKCLQRQTPHCFCNKRSQSAYFSDGEFLLFAFTCLTGSFFYLLLFVRRFGSPRNLNVTHGCARGFTLRVSPVPCLAHINIPVSLSHE